ncbi:hypothetical protein [Burkholderia cepacia]|uniref:hypothetical protein n=1 Tax=Burkholderia cepacia TaxID=292 RepID=UPI001F44B36A|nr:hypothetical protein [Burkholderia cepacia]UIY58162.1 hypothetical protein LZ568_08085 [Burkholderia cepacia]
MADLEQLAKWLREEASRHSISIAWRDPVIQEHVGMLRSWADLVDQAGRRTTPDREAIIEECAEKADYFARHSGVARNIAASIRALKTAPTSDKGGA